MLFFFLKYDSQGEKVHKQTTGLIGCLVLIYEIFSLCR